MAKPQTPDEIYDLNTRRAERVAWLIVIGLGVELVGLYWSDRPIWEIIVQAVADLLIAGGVGFELVFARIARGAGDNVQAEARKAVAEANARGAEAILRAEQERSRRAGLEYQVAQRLMTPLMRVEFPQKMSEFKGARADIVQDGDTTEIAGIVLALYVGLTTAGWEIARWQESAGVANTSFRIAIKPDADPSAQHAAKALADALSSMNILGIVGVQIDWARPVLMPNGEQRDVNKTAPIRVFIGSGPIPF